MNGLQNHKFNCQCGVCKAKRGEYKGKNSPSYGKHHTEATKEKMSIAKLNYIKNNPEKAFRERSAACKRAQELHPDMWKHGLNAIKQFAIDNPEEYHEQQVKSGRLGGKLVQELYPDLWQYAVKYLSDNSPFKYMGVGWTNSPVQRDITQLLFEHLGIISIKGVNCQIYEGRYEFDFRFLGIIYEPYALNQPFGRVETREEYTQRRRIAMNNNGHKDYELVVTTTSKEAENFINWLSERVYTISSTIKEELEKWRQK